MITQLRYVLLAIPAVVASACGQAPSPTAAVNTVAAPRVVAASPDGYVDPIRAEIFGWMTPAEVANNEQQMIASCMAEQGFEYKPTIQVDEEPLTRDAARTYRERNGFGRPTSMTASEASDAARGQLELLRAMNAEDLDGYLSALEGAERAEDRPSGGCIGRARDELANSVPFFRNDEETNAKFLQAYQTVYGSTEMKSALGAYASCMKALGHTAQTPEKTRVETQLAGPDGVLLALADWDCQAMHVWPVWDILYPTHVKQIIP